MHYDGCGNSTMQQQEEHRRGRGGHTTQQRMRAEDVRRSSAAKTSVGHRSLLEQIERQSYRCALSGEELTPETASLDHCTPISRGGGHDISNIQIVMQQINSAKGSMTTEEFVDMCRRVVAFQGTSD